MTQIYDTLVLLDPILMASFQVQDHKSEFTIRRGNTS